jgi:Cd2+/Zn2+-exporting ATPase
VFPVKVLNQARLDASVRAYGSSTAKITNKWPSPYVLICGACLLVSLFEHFWHPLRWFALGAVAAGLPPIVLRSIAAARRLTLDVNILMLIAGNEVPLVHRFTGMMPPLIEFVFV